MLKQVAAALALLVALVWLVQLGRAPRQIVAQRDCELRYDSARSRADTLLVDRQPLVVGEPAGSARTCGDLREAGRTGG